MSTALTQDGMDRALCALCAARLEGQLQIGWLSLLLTMTALAALSRDGASAWCVAAALLGLPERYLAARIAIDARLFRDLAQGMSAPALDGALEAMKMAAAEKSGRSLEQRVAGAMAWARRHTALVAAQVASLALGLRGLS